MSCEVPMSRQQRKYIRGAMCMIESKGESIEQRECDAVGSRGREEKKG